MGSYLSVGTKGKGRGTRDGIVSPVLRTRFSISKVQFSIFNLLFPLLLFSFSSAAQTTRPLSLADALTIALDRNHGILMAKNTTAMAQNRATVGNAGLLPTIGISSGGQWSHSISQLDILTPGAPTDPSGEATAFNAALNFSYVLFDGLGSIRNYRKLKIQGSISEVQERMVIENTLIAVAASYFEALMAAQAHSIAEENLKVTLSRLERQTTAHGLGLGNRILL
ncbi:MAG: TolC family protein, partial [Flavobacteriales bacterium]|nr:TolC family protein [Flavobacteriales bacterium]